MNNKIFGSGKYKYQVVENWAKMPPGRSIGDTCGVACDSKDRVYLFNRKPQPAVLVFDQKGNFLKSWGEDVFTTPHGIWISSDDHVWCTDTDDHTVRKFTLDGKLLMELGTRNKPGAPGEPFNKPSRVVLSSSGEVYVSDGYGQSRIHRFTPSGDLICSWGAPGKGAGEFNLPHSLCVDKQDRVFVLDRGNNRCQVFNSKGEYLTEWKALLSPNDFFIDSEGVAHIAEGGGRISVMTLEGKVIAQWGEKGTAPGQFSHAPHGFWMDSHGGVYIQEVIADNRFQKFERVS